MRKSWFVCLSLVVLSVLSLTGIAMAEEVVVVAAEENAAEGAPQATAVESALFPAEGCEAQESTQTPLFAAIPDPGCALNPGVNCNLTYKGYCDTFCGLNCSICQSNGCCICTVCQWP